MAKATSGAITYELQKSKAEPHFYCIKHRYLTRATLCLITPIALLVLASAVPHVHFLPTLQISQCTSPKKNYYNRITISMFGVIVIQFWHNLAFFACIYSLRFVEDKFTINKELRLICLVSSLCTGTFIASLIFLENSVFVKLGMCEYLIVINSLFMLYKTSVDPVLRSYKLSKIIPFSLSQECLRGLESAMI